MRPRIVSLAVWCAMKNVTNNPWQTVSSLELVMSCCALNGEGDLVGVVDRDLFMIRLHC